MRNPLGSGQQGWAQGPRESAESEGGIRGPAHTPLAESCCLWPKGSCSTVSPPSLGAAEKAGGRGDLNLAPFGPRRAGRGTGQRAPATTRPPLPRPGAEGLRGPPWAETRLFPTQRLVSGTGPLWAREGCWHRGKWQEFCRLPVTSLFSGTEGQEGPGGRGSLAPLPHGLPRKTDPLPTWEPQGPGGPGPEGAGASPSLGPRVRQPPSG